MADRIPPAPVIQSQLERLLASTTFKSTPRLEELLNVLVTATLTGKSLSTYQLGVSLFDKPLDWDPTEDGDVRTSLTRLRQKLGDYYKSEGADDPVRINIVRQTAVSRYNETSSRLPAPPRTLSEDFIEALERYFTDPYTGDIRCVVTGEPARWHHLDGDSYVPAIGNIIPLCDRLHHHINGLRDGSTKTSCNELNPRYLADELAPRYFAEWHLARAYGCAYLAFCMGAPPFGEEQPDVRILRLTRILVYVRRHFHESVVAHIIRSLIPLLLRTDSLDPRTLHRLTLQLSGLLDESGNGAAAEGAWALANGLKPHFSRLLNAPGSMIRFALLRRQGQLLMERDPTDKRFTDILKQAADQTDDSNLHFTLRNVALVRSLRQGTDRAAQRVHEELSPLVSQYAHTIFTNSGLVRPRDIDLVNLAELLIFSGIASCRVQPTGWEESAREVLVQGQRLCEMTGYMIPAEFCETISRQVYTINPRARRVFLFSQRQIKPHLRSETINDLHIILNLLRNIPVVEKGSLIP